MLTIEELESACSVSEFVELPRHEIAAAELPLHTVFFPYGFPVEVRTNSEVVLHQVSEMWDMFEKQHDTEPIQCDIQMVTGKSNECLPEPTSQFMLPLVMCIADGSNYSIVDLDRCRVKTTISQAALRHPLYAKYFFLGMAVCCVATRYTTPVHAGCVELDGRGVLLCGDSGAGKSSLSYACARAGWTYVSDDASFLLNGGSRRLISGHCHQVRFRPTAAQLFPELVGLEITPRAAGKPSIELPTAPMHLALAQTTRADFIVFLNRRTAGTPQLRPYRKDVARQFMRQTLYGCAEILAVQYEAIERLLAAPVFELRYSDLDWAEARLRRLVQEGQ